MLITEAPRQKSFGEVVAPLPREDRTWVPATPRLDVAVAAAASRARSPVATVEGS
jgi:hypothetical protein